MNDPLLSVATAFGILQIIIALTWLGMERRRSHIAWFAVLILLFGIRNLAQGVYQTEPDQQRLLSYIIAVVTPLTPFALIGGIFSLTLNGWSQSRLRLALFGLAALSGLAVLGDILAGAGLFYNATPGEEQLLAYGATAHLIAASQSRFFLFLSPISLLIGLIFLGGAYMRGTAKATRSFQVILILTLLAAIVAWVTFSSWVSPSSASMLANIIISSGLAIVMIATSVQVIDQLGRLVANQLIESKLKWGFGSLIGITLLVGALSIYFILNLNTKVQDTLSTQNRLAALANQMLNDYREIRRHELHFALHARTQGVSIAFNNHAHDMHGMTESLHKLIHQLRRENLTDKQSKEIEAIDALFEEYMQEVELIFDGYEQRGDRESGAVAEWLNAAHALDRHVNKLAIEDSKFKEHFVQLRTQQFNYLLADNSNIIGSAIQTFYDDLQRYALFSDFNAPVSERSQTQVLLGVEASAFKQLREITRSLAVRQSNVDRTSALLEDRIEEFATEANNEFELGVVEINSSGIFNIVAIIITAILSLIVAMVLSRIFSRQIAYPVLALRDAADKMAQGDLTVRAAVNSQDELGVAATAFNTMAARLQGILNTLEERVLQRTNQLETAAEVASVASEQRDLQDLLNTTTSLLVERFEDIYHAQVFLVDDRGDGEWAILRASSGEVGRQLLAQGHRLQVGSKSVIGQVTAKGEYVLSRTADLYSVHRPNDLLPNTKTELALPMRRQGRVIGALDVQSLRHYAFNDDDVQVLQTLANQLAIAVENARLFQNLGATIEETELLFRASSTIAGASSQDEVLDVFDPVVEKVGQVDRLTILLFDSFDERRRPVGAQIVKRWSHDPEKESPDFAEQMGEVVSSLWSALQRGLLEIGDINELAREYPSVHKILQSRGTQSMTIVPLETSGNYMGAVLLQKESLGVIPDEVSRIFRVLTQQTAVALTRFSLLDALSERVGELEQLRLSFLDLSSANSLDVLVQHLASRAASLVGAAAAGMYLFNEANGYMEMAAVHNIDEEVLGHRFDPGEGAAGHLIESRQPFIIEDYASWPGNSIRFSEMEQYKSVVAVPLVWQNRLLGAVTAVNLKGQRQFTQDDLRRLSLFADQAALTIENTRLLDETERSLKDTEALYSSTRALISATNEEEMVAAIVETAAAESDDTILILQVRRDTDPVIVEVTASNDATITLGTGPLQRSDSARALFPRGAHLPPALLAPPGIPPWEATSRIINELPASELAEEAQQLHEGAFQALMSVPIYTRQGFYGTILSLRQSDEPFTDEELTRYSTIASQFAVAYDNILLLEESQRAAAQLATAAEISRAASTELDVNVVLNRGIELMKEKFGFYHVQVFLLDDAKGWAELRASAGEIGQQMLAEKHRLAVGSRSVIGQATAEGRYVLARSQEVDPNTIHRTNPMLPDTQTELALPMKIGNEVIGALDVQSVNGAEFSETQDIEILQSLADQLAVAVQNARLFEQTQRNLYHSQALYQAGAAINEAENLDDLLRALWPLAGSFDPDQAVLMLFDQPIFENERPSGFTVAAGVNHRAELIPVLQSFRTAEFPLLRSLPVSSSIMVENVATSNKLSEIDRQELEERGIQALLYLPLRVGTRYMGWVGFNASAPRTISESALYRLANITQQAATALQSYRLLQEAQRRAWREEQISRITARLYSTTEPTEIMRIGLQELKQTLNLRRAMAWTHSVGQAEQEGPSASQNGEAGHNGHN